MKTDVNNRYIWFDGKIVNVNDAKINVLSPTSQFGLNVFEGIRCYWNESSGFLYAFRLDDHLRRLKRSQKLLQMDDCYTLNELKDAFIKVVRINEFKENISVRQTLFVDGFGTWSSTGPINMFISAIPKTNLSQEYNKKGLNCCISSWERINDNCLSPRIKCGANYINSRMAQREAINNGFDTAIFLNQYGKVAEGPGSCLFMVKEGKLITPLLTDSILESITRDTIIRISKEILNIPVIEKSIDRTELYLCDEAFFCGSAMEITPINSIDKYRICEKYNNSITKKIHNEYLKIVYGQNAIYQDWVTKVNDE